MEQLITNQLHDTTLKAKSTLPHWSLPDIAPITDSAQTLASPHNLHKAGSASEIFSASSQLNPQMTSGINDIIPLVDHNFIQWQVSLLILAVLIYYFFILYRFRTPTLSIFRTSVSVSKTLSAYEFQSNEQVLFSTFTMTLFVIGISLIATEYTNSMFALPYFAIFGISVGVVMVGMLYKNIVNYLCNIFSDEKNGDDIRKIYNHNVSLFALIYTPFAAAYAAGNMSGRFAIGILLILWIYYIVRLFTLFLKNGFGKLQWLLYLCTVEILPVSLIWALAVRY